MNLRVFVSHSAKEAQAKLVQSRLIARLQAAGGITPLMDQSNLEPGDRWRAHINLWIGACDVAVVLLSPAALESAYVAYEVSVLSYRESISKGRFRIIPIYLEAVDEKRLKASRLDPAQLTEIQRLKNKATPDEIADMVVEELAEIAAGKLQRQERPVDKLVARVRLLLTGVKKPAIDAAASALKNFGIPWEPDQDGLTPLAERLLGSGMADAIPALIALRNGMNREQKEDDLPQLVNLIACTWVDMKAMTRLPEIAHQPQRVVALNAVNPDTAWMYHLAASGGSDTWIWSPCDNVVPGEDAANLTIVDQLKGKVGAALRTSLSLAAEDDLQETLQTMEKYHVFLVAMPGDGVVENAEVTRALRDAFPLVTFFFLTGNVTAAETLEQIAELIVPQLHDDDEARFHKEYGSLKTNVLQVVKAGARR